MVALLNGDEDLSISEVSNLLDVSKQTVYRLVHDGILTAQSLGSGNGQMRFVIPREAVDVYLSSIRQITA